MTTLAKNVEMLARAAKCKDLSSVTVGATVPVPDLDDDVYRLNFESERTISEDFAFLTANEDGPTRVSAASLLATRQVASSVISIACNQGVHPNVRHAVGEVVAVVRAVADLRMFSYRSHLRFKTANSDSLCGQSQLCRTGRSATISHLECSQESHPRSSGVFSLQSSRRLLCRHDKDFTGRWPSPYKHADRVSCTSAQCRNGEV